jgi:hypothetical protein
MAVGLAGLLAGCALARRTPEMQYYTLAVPGAPAVRLAAPIRVGEFTADEPYRTTRLAYRTSPYRLDYYVYHRWAGDPRSVLATAARDYLEQAEAGDGAPLEMRGHIRRLEEVDGPSGRQGALALEVTVESGGHRLLEHAYAETEPADAARPEATVAALSRALGRILERVVSDLGAAAGPGSPPRRDGAAGIGPARTGRRGPAVAGTPRSLTLGGGSTGDHARAGAPPPRDRSRGVPATAGPLHRPASGTRTLTAPRTSPGRNPVAASSG